VGLGYDLAVGVGTSASTGFRKCKFEEQTVLVFSAALLSMHKKRIVDPSNFCESESTLP
jgi:hypothetical protein